MMFAMNREVDRNELLDFIRARKNWILTTVKQSGGIQISPVAGTINADGVLLISTYPERAKVSNLRANPSTTICVLSDEFGGAWVQVDGTAEIVDLPEAMEGLVDYYRNAAGDHPDWDEYREAMTRQGKCLIKISITEWGPVAIGGFPASQKASLERFAATKPDDSPAMFDD